MLVITLMYLAGFAMVGIALWGIGHDGAQRRKWPTGATICLVAFTVVLFALGKGDVGLAALVIGLISAIGGWMQARRGDPKWSFGLPVLLVLGVSFMTLSYWLDYRF